MLKVGSNEYRSSATHCKFISELSEEPAALLSVLFDNTYQETKNL